MKYLKLFFIVWVVLGTVSDEARAAVATREYCISVISACCGRTGDDLESTMSSFCHGGEKWEEAGLPSGGYSEDCKSLCEAAAESFSGENNYICNSLSGGGVMSDDVTTKINYLMDESSGDFCPSTTTSEGGQMPECGANAYQCQDSCCCNPHYNYNGEDNGIGANNDCTPNKYEFRLEDIPWKCNEKNTASFWYVHGPAINSGAGDSYYLQDEKGKNIDGGTLRLKELASLGGLDWRYRVIPDTSISMKIGDKTYYNITGGWEPGGTGDQWPVISGEKIAGFMSMLNTSAIPKPVRLVFPNDSRMFEGRPYILHYYNTDGETEFYGETCTFGTECKPDDLTDQLTLEEGQVFQGWVVEAKTATVSDGKIHQSKDYLTVEDDIDEYKCDFPDDTFDLYLYPAVTDCPAGYYCPPSNPWPPQVCPAGYYCPVGSKSPTECSVGFYCPKEGMDAPLPCDDGWYCEDDVNTEQKLCPQGNYCTGGTRKTCLPGYYCPDEGMAYQKPCDVGHYCPGTNNSTQQPCPGGTTTDDVADGGPGATLRTQCYITTGNSDATTFVDENKIPFQLPNFGDTRIYVK